MRKLYNKVFNQTDARDDEFYKNFLAKQLILRDYLAIERTILTNEATFLAYIRTSLTLLVVGVTLFHLSPENEFFQYIGLGFAFFGLYLFIRGAFHSTKMKKKIDNFLQKSREMDREIS